jgi:hypothetical protein
MFESVQFKNTTSVCIQYKAKAASLQLELRVVVFRINYWSVSYF